MLPPRISAKPKPRFLKDLTRRKKGFFSRDKSFLQSFNKMPLGPLELKKTRNPHEPIEDELSVLAVVGSLFFRLSYVAFWLVTPAPWQLPMEWLRRRLRADPTLVRFRLPARYLLATGFSINWLLAFALVRSIGGDEVIAAYVNGEYQARTVFALAASFGFCFSMTVLCCLQIAKPGLSTDLITPFVTGKALVESSWKSDLIEEIHVLIDRALPAKVKKTKDAARRQSAALRGFHALQTESEELVEQEQEHLEEYSVDNSRKDIVVDSSIWLFPLISSMFGFGIYCLMDWFLASQPNLMCTILLAPPESCVPPRFTSIDNAFCCGVLDMTNHPNRLIPTLGGYLGAGFGFVCTIGSLMVRWQLTVLNREIVKLLVHNRGILDSTKAITTGHSRVAQLDHDVSQMKEHIEKQMKEIRDVTTMLVKSQSRAHLNTMVVETQRQVERTRSRQAGRRDPAASDPTTAAPPSASFPEAGARIDAFAQLLSATIVADCIASNAGARRALQPLHRSGTDAKANGLKLKLRRARAGAQLVKKSGVQDTASGKREGLAVAGEIKLDKERSVSHGLTSTSTSGVNSQAERAADGVRKSAHNTKQPETAKVAFKSHPDAPVRRARPSSGVRGSLHSTQLDHSTLAADLTA